MVKLLFGCGYLGRRVADRWLAAKHEVVVVTRNDKKAAELERQGMRALVADISQPATLTNLPIADAVLFAVGFDRTPGQSIQDIYERGVENVLVALPPHTRRFIYISTTGIYGNAAGDWVDEQTPPAPQRDGGHASLAAERSLVHHPLGSNGVILRLAGLYGPGRVPFLAQLRNGEPIAAVSTGHLNLIHVDDAAEIVMAAEATGDFTDGPHIYCVSDGQPVVRGDYFQEIARQINAPPVQFTAPLPNAPRAARAEADRRINSAKLMSELEIKLQYSDYRAGLRAILSTL
jgi:nucleoside-diphosphate-sugar epimerase